MFLVKNVSVISYGLSRFSGNGINSNSQILCNCIAANKLYTSRRTLSNKIKLFNVEYETDEWTNINENIKEKLDRRLIHKKYHPLNHLTNKIKYFFNKTYFSHSSTPMFTIFDNFSPVVTVEQNFDSLLTPKDHVSRTKKDCFYVNKNYLLRAHTTAHTSELIRSGLNAFLTFGDVYRRDEIDSKHYPVFHQCDGARIFIKNELFNDDGATDIFEKQSDCSNKQRNTEKQACYTLDATKIVEYEMKNVLTSLANFIFGSCIIK
jgi:phenylalanyl-tRNA synthetase alpha chain